MELMNCILNKETAKAKLHRMALEIVENLVDETPVILIGIKENGIVIANIISNLLQQYIGQTQVISLKLDKKRPDNIELSEECDLTGKNIILIDDVCNSGRTMLYALKPLLEYYPKSIRTLILVERMHSLFPIKSDYVGMSIATNLHNHIEVRIENNEVEGAYLI